MTRVFKKCPRGQQRVANGLRLHRIREIDSPRSPIDGGDELGMGEGVDHGPEAGLPLHRSLIARLAAALGIERADIRHHLHAIYSL